MRRSAANAFYLAVFALFSGDCVARASPSPSTHASPDVCAIEPQSKVSDACATYGDLDGLNKELRPYLRDLVNNTDFFSYYRLNLYHKRCPFWNDENGVCGNVACAVTTLDDEEDVPSIWRAEELSKLQGPRAEHPGREQQRERPRPLLDQLGHDVGESCVVEYDDECDDRDYCVPDDESATAKGDYVSLLQNPERYTGYAGEGTQQVWQAIYRENCFLRPTTISSQSANVPGLSAPFAGFSPNQAQAAQDFKQVLRAHDRQQALASGQPVDTLEDEDECLEKRVFYRVVSGLHASISMHLCYDYLNQTTGEWGMNLDCYKARLHSHPERISNLYFNYALLLRAVDKLSDYLQDYTFCTGDPLQDQKTRQMVRTLAAAIPDSPRIFDESVMFQDQDPSVNGITLKEDFRNRFRNVSRIMDCVGCDKCRLWGKLQTNGLGTALKVLFEFGSVYNGELDTPLLRRTELVALINTLNKVSTSLEYYRQFRTLIQEEEQGLIGKPTRREEPDDFPCTDDSCAPPPSGDETIADAFWQELSLLTRAVRYVLNSWIELPSTLSTIAYGEFMRLTEFWLGRPVRPRTWEIKFPTRDEL